MMKIIWHILIIAALLAACPACVVADVEPGLPSPVPSTSSPSLTQVQPGVSTPIPTGLVSPEDFVHLGAFRLPGGDDRPGTFAYGGNAMTFRPCAPGANCDPVGSLFIMGHERMPYGELPDGNQVAEVSIPDLVRSRSVEDLNTGVFIQGFQPIAQGAFTGLDEIPRVGMAYLDRPETGPLIHIAWGQHFQMEPAPSHGWFSPDLIRPNMRGAWFIGEQSLYSVNDYLFEIPEHWAAALGGRYLATGRYRDGGWGGMGPALFAYTPWRADGSPPPAGAHLDEVTLLRYESSAETADIIRALAGYQHPDEWTGGAWLTTASGKEAVIFAGTKSTGTKYWYGFVHPDGPEYVCVEAEITDFPTCRMADGSVCPAGDFVGCCDAEAGGCASLRGWWSTRFDAQIIFYDPAGLARAARGEIAAWEPQPYAILDLDEYLYLDPPEWEWAALGVGDQRRSRLGDIAYDRGNGILYVLELFADGARPMVHAWQIGE